MSERIPSHIIQANKTPVENISVLRPLPTRARKYVGPFILFDHFGPHKVTGNGAVPPHPHAGFQTVTYLLKGKGQHTDSSGGSQAIEAGGVNWMTAGKGIVHAERMSGDTQDGTSEGFQIWVNLPAKDKYTTPGFAGYTPDQLPIHPLSHGQVRVIAGNWETTASPVSTFSPLFLYHLEVGEGAIVKIPVDGAHEAGIYVAKGVVDLGTAHASLEKGQLAIYEAGEGEISLQAQGASELIVLGGMALNEPMATYGPFVMNTREELKQVRKDYEMGKMGELTDW